jgi:hypothetical protein
MKAKANVFGAFTVTERPSRRTIHLVGRISNVKLMVFPSDCTVPAFRALTDWAGFVRRAMSAQRIECKPRTCSYANASRGRCANDAL